MDMLLEQRQLALQLLDRRLILLHQLDLLPDILLKPLLNHLLKQP